MTPRREPKFCFENTLHYSSPAHGDWGIVQIGMMLPESYQLFVCPSACGRHAAIGAMQHGLKDRLSFLYVDQSDIIAGYDSLIEEAVDELLRELSPWKPQAMLIFVSCLDDLIGTDHEALMSRLSKAHPEIRFRDCHMNPISLDSDSPPGVTLQKRMYSLLEGNATAPGHRDKAVNCVGCFEAIHPESDLHPFLASLGYPEIRHISQYERFSGFQAMARSTLNLVIGPGALGAAREMEGVLGIPHVFLPVSYRLEAIARAYETLTRALGGQCLPPFGFGQIEGETRAKIEEARKAAGDIPIIVDDSATVKPFELARALIEHGFRVERVVTGECLEIDRESFEWLMENAGGVEIIQPEHHNSVRFANRLEDSLAIGLDGAYLSGSKYLLDMIDDGGMWGYHGVKTLMERITAAVSREADLKAVIDSYGLVV
ncbi:MAG: nitrogenase component 1 [Synergistaceae bacterium]|jgi:nitrogenase molybdenum-iron protein alpha/beta subunit|nr:nitrogenase component 1 [Synergistaceae bacterium]